MKLEDCREAFHCDGSLRDIYVLNTTREDWNNFLTWLRCGDYRLTYTRDGEEARPPTLADDLLEDAEHSHNLVVDVDGVSLCCHFFSTNEIELDLVPNEVASQAALDGVLSFMVGLGTCLSTDVILTEENRLEDIWFTYTHADKQLRIEAERPGTSLTD